MNPRGNLRLDGRVFSWGTPQFNAHLTNIPQSPTSNPLTLNLVHKLSNPVKQNLIPLSLIGSFFEFVPSRLNLNPALDDAVSCFCAIYSGPPSTPYYLQKGVSQSYVKALSSLRSALSDEKRRMEPETLCASIILPLCEVSLHS